MSENYYKKGDWNAICDRCGFKFKASELKREWTGLMVCPRDWEPRQPQDFVRGVVDDASVEWTRSESLDTFINPGDVKPENL